MKSELSVDEVKRLVRQELSRPEDEGMVLYEKMSTGKMSQAEFNASLKELNGYGKWWGFEASHSLVDLKIVGTKDMGDGVVEVTTRCTLSRLSGHSYEEGMEPDTSYADVTLRVDKDMKVLEFGLEW